MLSALVALLSISSLGILYRATSNSATSLSPQGCRMSYMSPSYLIQSQFDTSWTPLAKRYSLLLYREVGWEDDEVSFGSHPHLLSAFTNIQVASRGPSPLHPWKCWVCSPDPFNSLVSHTAILFVSVHPFTRVYLSWHQTS